MKPLGIDTGKLDTTLLPAEHLALEAEGLARHAAHLLARADATPTLRDSQQRRLLADAVQLLRQAAR